MWPDLLWDSRKAACGPSAILTSGGGLPSGSMGASRPSGLTARRSASLLGLCGTEQARAAAVHIRDSAVSRCACILADRALSGLPGRDFFRIEHVDSNLPHEGSRTAVRHHERPGRLRLPGSSGACAGGCVRLRPHQIAARCVFHGEYLAAFGFISTLTCRRFSISSSADKSERFHEKQLGV
jgi:hypothetical protein